MEKPKNKALAGLDKTKSFKQKKKIQKGTRGYQLKQIARMTLGSGNMQLAVELPAGEDLNEWLAVNTIEFYNEINVLYGILMEFCTAESCPTMSAGPKYEYLWADGHNVKTPLKVSAGEYIDFLMTWVENQLNNEKIFPCALGVPFPKNFMGIIKVIFKRLFRVYAHIYHTHFQHIMLLSAETHLNTCFKHFIYFIDQFNLVDSRELAPLAELIQQFKERKNEASDGPISQAGVSGVGQQSQTSYPGQMMSGQMGATNVASTTGGFSNQGYNNAVSPGYAAGGMEVGAAQPEQIRSRY